MRLQPKDDHNLAGQPTLSGDEAAAKAVDDILATLQAVRPDAKVNKKSFVGPQVGEELRSDGVYSVIVGIMGYLWIRFERRFAIAALVTEVHDVLVNLAHPLLMWDHHAGQSCGRGLQ